MFILWETDFLSTHKFGSCMCYSSVAISCISEVAAYYAAGLLLMCECSRIHVVSSCFPVSLLVQISSLQTEMGKIYTGENDNHLEYYSPRNILHLFTFKFISNLCSTQAKTHVILHLWALLAKHANFPCPIKMHTLITVKPNPIQRWCSHNAAPRFYQTAICM